MKKFLTFLVSVLFTLSSFGQGSLNLEHLSGTIQKVGDEFVLKIQYYTGDQGDATLIQFDYEYNNKLLEITDFTWKAPSGYSHDNSVETSFEGTAQVDGLTVWKSNGEVPFADMLLDFVQIGAITFEHA